ncbi:MAG TPA: YfhO family protein [Thermoanaerobaculia bacterium]|nr:YfhO family protein [Thermoanaerobaculia bacterium]
MKDIVLAAAGVVLPSLVITVAVRRWLEPVSWRMAGLCLAIALAVTGGGIFTSGMPVPLDEVVRGYPYRGIFGEVVSKNELTNDTVKQILPWMHTVREQMFAGRFPLWNPHLFSGYPLLGNGQSAPFSPFFLTTLFVPLPKQIVAMAGLKLFTALLFGFLLARREGVPDAAAMFASVVFALAIFNNVFLYYPMTAVTLLLPAAAYAVLLALRTKRRAPVFLVAVTVAALLAGGHPESVVHVAVAALALVAVEWIAPRWGAARFGWCDLLRVTFAALLGLAIAAPAWVPVVEQAVVSVRVDSLRSVEAAPTFPSTALWAMLNPDGFGNPARRNWSWIYAYTHIASLYLGLIVTALLPAAVLARRAAARERLLIGAAVIFFLGGMKWGVVADLFYAAPPLSWVAHDRFRFVVCFFVALAIAHVLGRFAKVEWALTALTAAILLGLAVYVLTVMQTRGLFFPQLTIGVAVLVLFIVAAGVWRRHAALLAAVLTAVELFVFNLPYNAIVPGRYYVPSLPIIEALKADASKHRQPYRVLGFDWVFLPNAAAHYGLEDIRGSDPMAWGEYGRFLRTAAVEDPWIEDVKRIANATHPIIDFLNVRYLLTEPGMEPGESWELLYRGVDGGLYRNREYQPRFFVPRQLRRVGEGEWENEIRASSTFARAPLIHGGDLPPVIVNPEGEVGVRFWTPTKFRLAVRAEGPLWIASSQPAARWWTIESGGERLPQARVNGAFLGFRVPAGSSDVLVEYRPVSFWVSVGVALAAMVALVFWLKSLAASAE